MAEIDPDVARLLSGLLQSPLAALGRLAIERITADDNDEEDEAGSAVADLDPQAQRMVFLKEPRRRRFYQLSLADKVILSRLSRELAISDRLRELAPALELKSIVVTPKPARGDVAVADATDEDLLGLERAAAIIAFQKAWIAAANGLRNAWETPDGD